MKTNSRKEGLVILSDSSTRVKAVVLVIAGLLSLTIYLSAHDVHVHSVNNQARISYIKAQHKMRTTHKRAKQPIIHKTIPSAYKQMLSAGHTVCQTEDQVMMRASKSKNPKVKNNVTQGTKPVATNQEINTFKHYMSDGGADNNLYYYPWNVNFHDTVKIIPGTANQLGDYQCAFIVEHGKRLDAAYTTTFDPNSGMFGNISPFNSNIKKVTSSNRKKIASKVSHKQHKKVPSKSLKNALKKGIKASNKPNSKSPANKPKSNAKPKPNRKR